MKIGLVIAALLVAGAGAYMFKDRIWALFAPAPLNAAALDALYAAPADPPSGPVSILYLGHSLVGSDMPAMVAQIAGESHSYNAQLGWGTSLKNHWDGREAIAGFEEMNAAPVYRDGREALASGEYSALVLTEMVEIKDAIRYHDTPRYMAEWLKTALAGNPDIRLYLYETWHQLNDPEGWLERIDRDLTTYWEDAALRPALARLETPKPVYIIPGGQVMAAFTRALDSGQAFPGLYDRTDLFVKEPDGTQDQIHFNAWGAYLMALTQYAVIYGADPRGVTSDVTLADGSPMPPLPEGAAALMQQIVWETVTSYPRTGIRTE